MFSEMCGRDVDVVPASEFRYRAGSLDARHARHRHFAEWRDDRRAGGDAEARRRGSRDSRPSSTRPNSSLDRMVDARVHLRAGVEQCVLATKSYTAMLAALLLAAYDLAGERSAGEAAVCSAARAADAIESMLATRHRPLQTSGRNSLGEIISFVIGRGVHYPSALEAALKIKEVSYIHAEGFAAGELKHGVIALIEPGTPCLVFAPTTRRGRTCSPAPPSCGAAAGYIIGVGRNADDVFDEFIPVPDARSWPVRSSRRCPANSSAMRGTGPRPRSGPATQSGQERDGEVTAAGIRPPIIDTHVHLDEPAFDADLGYVLDSARAVGVRRFVNIGYKPERWESSRALRQAHPDVDIVLGLHPQEAAAFNEELERNLRETIASLRPLAVGEIGFDFFRSTPTQAEQEHAFRAQLAIAEDFGLPVVIHQRNAGDVLMTELERWPGLAPIVLHSFDGNRRLTDWAIERRCFHRHRWSGLQTVVRTASRIAQGGGGGPTAAGNGCAVSIAAEEQRPPQLTCQSPVDCRHPCPALAHESGGTVLDNHAQC